VQQIMKNDKEEKETRLLNTAFKLFTEKGIKETSIQEIVDNASVAKGTFYLYFKDKYEIRDILIVKKSQKLFSDALKSLRKNYISDFSDCIIYIINYVIDELTKNPLLLKFISKNLSWGVFSKTVLNLYDKSSEEENSVYDLFIKESEKNNIKFNNPEVILFMIIELVGSTCFNSILYKEPLPIEEYKPYLYRTIRNLIKYEEI
jgi:transcriptional regulator